MPSLLIVTEKFDVGGLETYIRGQVRAMTRAGWRVMLACGGQPRPELLPDDIADACRGLPLGGAANAGHLLHATRTLRQFIQAHGITHVHAHPFTSLFPALLAAKLEGVPYIATLHGPSSLDAGYGPFNDFLLGGMVLGHADRVIAVSEEVGQLAAPYVGPDVLAVQPNAVDTEVFEAGPAPVEASRWLLVSRLDAFKIVGIRQFAKEARAAGLPGIDVAGDGPAQGHLQEQLAQDGLGEFVRFLGVRTDIAELMRASAGVAGMGRVLLEGLASGRPCCLVGYDGVKGMVDATLFDAAASANFSGRNLPNIGSGQLREQLAGLAGHGDPAPSRKVVAAYAEATVWQGFADSITPLPARPVPVLTAMYDVLQTEAVQADTVPYLHSDDFWYQVGRVLHGARHYAPGLADAYAFHARRAQQLAARHERAAAAQKDTSAANELAQLRQELTGLREQVDALRQILHAHLAAQEDKSAWWSRWMRKAPRA
ncbi:glycosyltransferase [Bordetella petrii]|uniref:glycosyltransferase n=1 Tax=Bordetella petrii TaxID=94624 RepID=UPI001E4ECB5B|nr:glycosyltransferase [Bordetella petrii]MCD0504145.1 glycosyltransferase [Bordetella petrii]